MLINISLHMALRSNKTNGQLLGCCSNTAVKMCYFTVPSPVPRDVLAFAAQGNILKQLEIY